MTPAMIATIIGLVLTTAFGFWGVYATVLHRRYPGRLSFVVESCFPLFESIVKHMSDLAIRFKGEPINEGLVLLNGWIVNTGYRDISENMIERHLRIEAPERFVWRAATVVNSSPAVVADLAIEANSLVFKTGLLRRKEFIRFQAIVEMPMGNASGNHSHDGALLLDSIRLSHRIAETKSPDMLHLPFAYGARHSRRHLPKLLVFGVLIAVLLGTIFIYNPKTAIYTINSEHIVTAVDVTAKAVRGGQLRVRSLPGFEEFDERMPPDEFLAVVDGAVVDTDYRLKQIFILVNTSYAVVLALMYAWLYYSDRPKYKSLRKLLLGHASTNEDVFTYPSRPHGPPPAGGDR